MIWFALAYVALVAIIIRLWLAGTIRPGDKGDFDV